MKPRRPRGLYWIMRRGDGAFQAARWSGGHWTLLGQVVPILDEDVAAVCPVRLVPPRVTRRMMEAL